MSERRLNDEECRILIAIQEDRFAVNKHGRYVIDGEERPDRKTRERLASRGLIDYFWTRERQSQWRVTAKGKLALDAEIQARVAARRASSVAEEPPK